MVQEQVHAEPIELTDSSSTRWLGATPLAEELPIPVQFHVTI